MINYTLYIISQSIGFIAILVYGCGYFSKTKTKYLLFTLCGDFFYGISYIIALNFAPAVLALTSMLQMFVFYLFEKRNKKVPIYVVIICISIRIGATLLFFDGLLDIVPMIASTLFAFIYCIRNVQLVRYLSIIPNILQTVYNFTILMILNGLVDFFDCLQLTLAIINHNLKNNPKHIKKLEERKKYALARKQAKMAYKIATKKKRKVKDNESFDKLSTIEKLERLTTADELALGLDILSEEEKLKYTEPENETEELNMKAENLIVNSNNFLNPNKNIKTK